MKEGKKMAKEAGKLLPRSKLNLRERVENPRAGVPCLERRCLIQCE